MDSCYIDTRSDIVLCEVGHFDTDLPGVKQEHLRGDGTAREALLPGALRALGGQSPRVKMCWRTILTI